jgi:hypothetical protein
MIQWAGMWSRKDCMKIFVGKKHLQNGNIEEREGDERKPRRLIVHK